MTHDDASDHIGSNLGMASMVLAIIAMFFFFIPIMALPLGLVALALGVVGFVATLFSKDLSLRWAVGGLAVSGMALAVIMAIVINS
jgi:hypothetical protein